MALINRDGFYHAIDQRNATDDATERRNAVDPYRQLLAAVMYQALADVAFGPDEAADDALEWINGPKGQSAADWLDITPWPPDREVYLRMKVEHLALSKRQSAGHRNRKQTGES